MTKPRTVYSLFAVLAVACYAATYAVGQEDKSPQPMLVEADDHDGHGHDDHGEKHPNEEMDDVHEGHAGHDHGGEHPGEEADDAHDDHPPSPEGSGVAGEGHHDHEGHDHGDEHPGKAADDAHENHEGHGDHQGHDDHRGHDDHEDEGGIRLDQQTMQEFDIPIEVAGPARLNLGTTLPGEVQVNQDRTAHIVPRYPGLVIDVKKHIGDYVRNGDVLAVLEGNESLSQYELKSLIDGTIIDKHITLGESVKEDDIVFTISDLSSVWVDLTVYQKDLGTIHSGQKVKVSAGEHGTDAEGSISYVSPTVDEHTRTSLARVVLENPDGKWPPGLFVTGRIIDTAAEARVAVPRDAVITIDGRPSVFVQTDVGLAPRPVKLGRSDDHRVEVLSGLRTGERYAARNVLPLKAELNRAALEHAGHAH